MKKIIGFDLDDTLAITKSPISDRMAGALSRLLENYDVCVITGGTFQQIKKQVIDRLNVQSELLQGFHAMPTCGTRYYRFNAANNEWRMQYANDLSDKQKAQITMALEEVAREMGIWCDNPAGEIIEDRHSQITMSALGQQATPEDKYAWAEKYKDIRPVYRDKVAEKLPGLEVRIGGTTSTDITLPGIDKAYGIGKLLELNGWSKEEALFFGDKLQEGGNDFPVKNMGIDCIAVERWEDTAYALEGINAVS
ncbi:HAD-IIB family hydrolase [Candidatus Nanosynbacter sp. TM7-074]|uniref:phosphomannomutase n=1 Tax=Candidatus Nanosynbacter sp. TM7-074 TaxID=3158573 RepID=A0AB39J6N1_9BACT